MNELTRLSAAYPYRTELHAHTKPASICGHLLPERLIELYHSLGANSITITNHLNTVSMGDRSPEQYAHDYLEDYYRTKAAGEAVGMDVIFGVEIRFDSVNKNDYLVYGADPEELPAMIEFLSGDLETFYREFKNDRNLILQAHPFRDHITLAPLSCLDGVEVFNLHPGHNSRISWAAKYAKGNRLLMSGGSDVHREDRAGGCFLRTKEPIKDTHDVVKALLSRDILFETWGNLIVPYYED